MNKKIVSFLIIIVLVFTTGFTSFSNKPRDLYRVYLKGESLGLIESKEELENYIDQEQREIKKKYNVKKVYVPADLDIVKETTFDGRVKPVEDIYEEIKDISPFTINGYVVKIKGLDTTTTDGKVVKGTTQKIYVTQKSVFTNSIEKTVKSFISEDDFNNYANDTQKEIEDVGQIIENIYIKN